MLKHVGLKGALPYRLGNAVRSVRNRDGDGGPLWLAPALRRGFREQQDPWAWKVGSSGPRWWRHLSDQLVEAPNRELRIDYLRHRAAAAGLVNDSPLYDVDLVDYCLRLPPELAFGPEYTRPLVRHATARLDPGRGQAQQREGGLLVLLLRDPHERRRTGHRASPGRPSPGDRRLRGHGVGAPPLVPRPAGTGQTHRAVGHGDLAYRCGECWLRAQADPGFVDDMLAREDVLAPSAHRVSLGYTGTFFRLAGT